jgi:hypothetical protein
MSLTTTVAEQNGTFDADLVHLHDGGGWGYRFNRYPTDHLADVNNMIGRTPIPRPAHTVESRTLGARR